MCGLQISEGFVVWVGCWWMGRCASLFNNCWVNYKCIIILYYYIFCIKFNYWSNEKLCDEIFNQNPQNYQTWYIFRVQIWYRVGRYSKFLCWQFLETWIYTTTSCRLRCIQTSSSFKTLIKQKLCQKHSFFLLTHMLQSQNVNRAVFTRYPFINRCL